jgi:hypothetical protein
MAQQVVLAISGSPSSKSRTALVAQHVLDLLRTENLETRFLSVRDLPAEALLRGNTSEPQIAEALAAVEQASGIVFATPIFKAAYSGLLKCMLDILPQFALAGKAILAYRHWWQRGSRSSARLRLAAGSAVHGCPAYCTKSFFSREGCDDRARRRRAGSGDGYPAWRSRSPLQGFAGFDRDRRLDGTPATRATDLGEQFYSLHRGHRAEEDGRLDCRSRRAGRVYK